MQDSTLDRGGMFVAPHAAAAEAGVDILREGGNAIEAMVAAASTIAVTYPHMNALGGDGFWLIAEPGRAPVGIEACGPAAQLADSAFYAGLQAIPARGPLAALTTAGTVAGWAEALRESRRWGGRMPTARLLEAAIAHAKDGSVVTRGQTALTASHLHSLQDMPGFAEHFLSAGQAPATGSRFRQPALASTLEQLARAGLDDFYRGELGAAMGDDLERLGSPLRQADLRNFWAQSVTPLTLSLREGRIWNLPPPTQGVASLMILGLFERLGLGVGDGAGKGLGKAQAESFAYVHALVESTKRAFVARDRYVTDPGWMDIDPATLLAADYLDELAKQIDTERAMPWPHPGEPGDTVWMGCVDGEGRAVSFIQSTYWEFGSGVVLPSSGVVWQNRGIGFSLDPGSRQALEPGRKPFHTLNPALARLDDGRTLVYGTMGGEGQPQTQAAIFTRHVHHRQSWQQAIDAPRWLLGRTWGEGTASLKLEGRFDAALIERLRKAGHEVDVVEGYSQIMGHAGGITRYADGTLEGGFDPRSDGGVASF